MAKSLYGILGNIGLVLLFILLGNLKLKALEIIQGDTLELCSLSYPVTLNATSGLSQYQWSNGSNTDFTSISQPGVYWLSALENGSIVTDTIYVITLPMTFEIFKTDTTYFCATDTPLTISSNDIFNTSGIWNTGYIGNSININQSGKYWFTAIDSFFCLTQIDTIQGIALDNGATLNFNSPQSVCAEAYPLDIYVKLGENPIWQDSSTDYFLTISQAGTYTYQSQLGACALIYDTIVIQSITLQAPALCCDTSACLPDSIYLSLPNGYIDYFWSTGQNAPSIYINKEGVFDVYVRVTDSSNCSAITDTITIELFDSIPTPSISQNGIFLVVSPSGYNYQWYKDDTLIIGATQPAILDTIPGTYCAKISRGICFDTICYTVIDTGRIDTTVGFVPVSTDFKSLNITPNPARDIITLGSLNEPYLISITDIIGKEWVVKKADRFNTHLDISILPQGLYFVTIQSYNGPKLTKRLLKQY